jgi:hypothetical protein
VDLNVFTSRDAERVAAKVKATTEAPRDIAERGVTAKAAPQVTTDDLYARILKYIPAPLIGLYLMITNLWLGVLKGGAEEVAAWITLVAFAALVVAFLLNRKVRRKSQIAVSVLAFVAWAAASPGPFELIGGWNEAFGTIALAAAVALLVVFRPGPLPDSVIEETAGG